MFGEGSEQRGSSREKEGRYVGIAPWWGKAKGGGSCRLFQERGFCWQELLWEVGVLECFLTSKCDQKPNHFGGREFTNMA